MLPRSEGRNQAKQLHYVVRDHISQCTRRIEISAPLLDTHRLCIRDLHMVDVTAVPDWLEDGVIETKHHDVLDGFFSQVVIDAIDLLFGKYRFDLPV